MKQTKRLLACLTLMLLCACGSRDFAHLKKLEGVWQKGDDRGLTNVYEEWQWVHDTLMRGSSYSIAGSEKTVLETMTLEKTKQGIHYVATVTDQNNGRPTTFVLSGASRNTYSFENEAHDFPQKIIYRLYTDSIAVGLEGGAYKIQFYYKRVN